MVGRSFSCIMLTPNEYKSSFMSLPPPRAIHHQPLPSNSVKLVLHKSDPPWKSWHLLFSHSHSRSRWPQRSRGYYSILSQQSDPFIPRSDHDQMDADEWWWIDRMARNSKVQWHCKFTHNFPNEIKERLRIAVGPRYEEYWFLNNRRTSDNILKMFIKKEIIRFLVRRCSIMSPLYLIYSWISVDSPLQVSAGYAADSQLFRGG